MPVQATETYVEGLRSVNKQEIDWVNDTFQAMLLVDGHVKDVQNHKFVQTIQGDEHAATGNYTRQPVSGRALGAVGANSEFDSDAVNFGADTTIDARYLVVYKLVTNDTDSLVLFIVDLTGGGNASSSNGNFIYTPSQNGWAQWRPNQ